MLHLAAHLGQAHLGVLGVAQRVLRADVAGPQPDRGDGARVHRYVLRPLPRHAVRVLILQKCRQVTPDHRRCELLHRLEHGLGFNGLQRQVRPLLVKVRGQVHRIQHRGQLYVALRRVLEVRLKRLHGAAGQVDDGLESRAVVAHARAHAVSALVDRLREAGSVAVEVAHGDAVDVVLKRGDEHLVPVVILGKVAHAQVLAHGLTVLLEVVVLRDHQVTQGVDALLHLGVVVLGAEQLGEPVGFQHAVAVQHLVPERVALIGRGARQVAMAVAQLVHHVGQASRQLLVVGHGVKQIFAELVALLLLVLVAIGQVAHQHRVDLVDLLGALLRDVLHHHVRVHRGHAREQRVAHAVGRGDEQAFHVAKPYLAGYARRRVLGQQVQIRLVDVLAHEAHAVAVGRALLHWNGHRAAVDAVHVQVELVVELGTMRIKGDGERPVGVLLGALVVQRVAERFRFLAVVDEPLRFAARHHVETLDGRAARVGDVGRGRRLLRARKVGLQHHALARHQIVGDVVVDRSATQLVARAGEALAAHLQFHAGIRRRVHRGLVTRNGCDLGRRQLDAGIVDAHVRGAQRQHGVAELKRRVHRARARALRGEAHEQVAGLRTTQVNRHDIAVAREGQLLGFVADGPADGYVGEVALGHLQLQHGIALLVKVETNPDLRFHARHDGTAIGHHAALLHNAALCKVRRRVEHGHVKGHLRLRAVLDLHLGARVLHAFLKFQAVEGGQRGHTQVDARVVHGDHRVLAGLQAFKRKRQFTCGI